MRHPFPRACLAVACLLIIAVPGCKKDGAEGPGREKAAMQSDVGTVAFPADVLVFGGIKSLDDFTQAMTGLVSKFEPQMGALIGAQIPALLQGQVLGVKNLAWLDHTKPLRFVVLDYKKYANPLLLVLPIKTQEAFTAALPDNKTEGAPDNQTRFTTVTGTENFVNVVGDWAVFSTDAKTFALVKPFLDGGFKDYQFIELMDVQVSSTHFLKVAGEDIKAFADTMDNMPATPGLEIPGIQEMLKKEVEMFMSLLEQTQTARIVMKYDGDNLGLNSSVKVVPGKGLARFVDGTRSRQLELYKGLPADGWFVGAVNLDPKLFEDWATMGVEFWASMLKLEKEEQDKLQGLMAQLLAVETGDSAFWIGYDGDFPFRFLSITGITDPVKAKAALYETYGILFAKAGALIQSLAGPELATMPKMDWSSPKTLLASLKPELDKTGVTMDLKSQKVGDVDVDSLDIGVDYTKVPLPAGDEDLKEITDALGTKLSGALGFSKDRIYGTFGKAAVSDIEAISKGGNGDQLKDIIAGAKTRVAGAVWFGLRDVLRIVAKIDDDIAQGMPNLETEKDPIGVTFLIGGRDERIMDANVAIPISKIAALLSRPGVPAGGASVTP